MKISVLGSGCPTCETLYNMVKAVVKENKIDAEVEYIKDVNELIKRGIMMSPALLINDKPVKIGLPRTKGELLEIIQENSR